MVEQNATLDVVFSALASSARREMLNRLAEHPLSVGELAQPSTISLATTSKHTKVLERAGLIEQTIIGRRRLCHLVARPLVAAPFGSGPTSTPRKSVLASLWATFSPVSKKKAYDHDRPSPPRQTAGQRQRARPALAWSP